MVQVETSVTVSEDGAPANEMTRLEIERSTEAGAPEGPVDHNIANKLRSLQPISCHIAARSTFQ